MKKLLALALSLAMVLSLAACGSKTEEPKQDDSSADNNPPAEEVVHIMFGHDNLPGEPLTMAAEYWAEKLKEVSGGTMVLDVYDSSSAGSKTDLLDQLVAGDAVMVVGDGGTAADYGVSDMNIIMGPYLFSDWSQVDKLVQSDLWADLKNQMADAGMTIVSDNWQYGCRSTMSSKKLETPDDFKGLLIRVPNSSAYIDGMTALGAAPTAMSLNEVYTALQQKTVDAVENPLSTLLANSFDEVCKYLLLDRHMYQVQFVILNTDFFNSLTEQQQKWLLETGEMASKYQNELMMKAEADNVQVMLDRGVEITEIDFDTFAEAAKSFYTDSACAANWSDGLYDRVLAIING